MILYEYCNTGDEGIELIFGADVWAAQSFTVGTTGSNVNFTISSVKLKVGKMTPTEVNDCDVSIQTVDGSGQPTGTILSSGTFDGDTLPEIPNSEWKEVTMSPYILQASTQYAIVVKALNVTGLARLTWRWGDNTYSGGIYMMTEDAGDTWIDWDDYEFMFEIWGAGVAQINIGDAWKEISGAKINIGDAWKPITSIKINIGDTWKTIA